MVVTRSTPTTSDALAISSFRAAAAKGPVLVRVFGSPVAAPPATVAPAIAARLPTPAGRTPTRFTSDPTEAGSRSTRVVLLFGAPQAVDGAAACEMESAGLSEMIAPRADTTILQAALCNGVAPLRAARLRGPVVAGLDDPALDALLWRAMHELVPWRDREKTAPCRRWPTC